MPHSLDRPSLCAMSAALLLMTLVSCGGGQGADGAATSAAAGGSANASADAGSLVAQSTGSATPVAPPATGGSTTTSAGSPTTAATGSSSTTSPPATSTTTTPPTTTAPSGGAAAATTPITTGASPSAPASAPVSTTSPGAGTTPTAPSGSTGSGTPAVEYFGRFDNSQSAGPRFAWSGSTVKARFNGTWVTARLKNSGGDINLTAVVDGGTPTTIKSKAGTTTSFTLASGLVGGEHTVQLTRNNEAFNGTTQFLGFEFGGTLLAPAAFQSPLKLEVYGDSISAALGDMRLTDCSSYSVDDENAYQGYAFKAARTLGAQPPTIIAWSGKGVYHNGTGGVPGVDTIPATYDRSVGSEKLVWDFPADKTPDVVVLALGTNDVNPLPSGSPPADAVLTDAYVSFARTLRGRYPQASLVFAIGPMTYAYQAAAQNAVAQLNASGDAKAYSLVHSANKSPTGCDSHPSEAQHTVMAAELVALLRKLGY